MATAGVADAQRKHPMKGEGAVKPQGAFLGPLQCHCPHTAPMLGITEMKRLNQHDEMFNEKGPQCGSEAELGHE